MIHEINVLLVVVTYLLQAVGELLTLTKQLFVTAKATRHGVSSRIDYFRIRKDEFDEPHVEKVVWHFVDKTRCRASVGARVIDKLLANCSNRSAGSSPKYADSVASRPPYLGRAIACQIENVVNSIVPSTLAMRVFALAGLSQHEATRQ